MSESKPPQNPITPHPPESNPSEEGSSDQGQPFEQVANKFAAMVMRGPARSQLVEKFDSDHVHKIIDNTEEDSKRQHDREVLGLWLTSLLVVAGLVGVFALSWLFLSFNQAEHLDALIALIIGLIGGGVGGYGFGRNTSQ